MSSGLRVALVHDWLVTWGGSESVLLSLANLFPQAPIFTSVWNPAPRVREAFGEREVRTTILQSIPLSGGNHRKLLPLMPGAFRALDLSAFDLVISDSHAFSKAVRARPGATHLCYCHTPPRYLWDMSESYLPGWKGRAIAPLLSRLRRADLEAARGVTHFLANSAFVAERIRRTYGREARVVHPPVDVEFFASSETRGARFVAGGRLVSYKRVDLAVEAANRGGFPLLVFGDGPEAKRLRRMAGSTVEFAGELDTEGVRRALAESRAFLFPGVEDFGILPVEAQAAGTPVVALREGGCLETVVEGETGVFFEEPTVESLLEGIRAFEAREWDPALCRKNASSFSRGRFEEEISSHIQSLL